MEKNERKVIYIDPENSSNSIELSAWAEMDIFVSTGEEEEETVIRFTQSEFAEFIEACKQILNFAKGG